MLDKILRFFASPFAKALDEQLKQVEQWDINEHTIIHTKSGVVLWIASEVWFLNGHGRTPKCLTLVDKFFLWNKVHRMISIHMAAKLEGLVE